MARTDDTTSRTLLIGVVFCAIIGLIIYATFMTQPAWLSGATGGHDASFAAPALTGERR